MKIRLCVLLVPLCALLAAVPDQPMKYIEEGDTLSLTPDVSTIKKPFKHSIWGKNGWVADLIPPQDFKYFKSYENRTHLNIETLQLDIDGLTLADSGNYSLVIDDAPVGTYPVKVILRPSMPQLRFACVVTCDIETLHLGPVTYHWRINDGEWWLGDKKLTLSRPEEPETITCKVATRLRHSNASLPEDNPLYEPPPPPNAPQVCSLTYQPQTPTSLTGADQPMEYIEEGGTLSLKPDVSTIKKPFRHIIWRTKGWVAELKRNGSGPFRTFEYFGSYKDCTHLNNKTLQLDIHHLTLNDSGTFFLVIDKATVGTYPVQVILRPSTPQLRFACEQDQPCVVTCDMETLHLGPVTFYWRINDGAWRPGDKQLTLSRPEKPETITCKVATRLRHSNASLPEDNPLYEPPPPSCHCWINDGWVIAGIVLIAVILLIAAAVAGAVFLPKLHTTYLLSKKRKHLKSLSGQTEQEDSTQEPLNVEMKTMDHTN